MSYYKSILTFLKNEKYLALPGIGAWSINTIPAHIQSNNELVPAHTLLEFRTDFNGTQYQKQILNLSKAWSCSDVEARQVLLKLGSKILDASCQHERYLLPGIGYVLFEDNAVQFESSGAIERSFNYFNENQSLQKVFKLKVASESESNSIASIKEEVVETSSPVISIVKAKKARPWIRYAAAILLFSIIGFSGWNLVSEADRILLPVKYNLDSSGYDVEAFNRSPETDGSENNMDYILEEEDSTIENRIEKETFDDSKMELSDLEVTDSPTNDCIYILGSFGNKVNVERMMNTIEKLGLDIYRERRGNNIRIGAVIPCNDQLSLSQLKQIEPNTWLLD